MSGASAMRLAVATTTPGAAITELTPAWTLSHRLLLVRVPATPPHPGSARKRIRERALHAGGASRAGCGCPPDVQVFLERAIIWLAEPMMRSGSRVGSVLWLGITGIVAVTVFFAPVISGGWCAVLASAFWTGSGRGGRMVTLFSNDGRSEVSLGQLMGPAIGQD